MKSSVQCFINVNIHCQWVGPIQDMVEEFHKIDVNKGGYILFGEFIEWALLKNLDIEDDVD